jgi:hypothetical protein
MEELMPEKRPNNSSEIYEIKIQGHLDTQWSDWFYGMQIIHEPDEATTLSGALPDQTVLHSVLDRIQNMNLQLISVKKIN